MKNPLDNLAFIHISDDRHSAEFGRLLIGEPCCQGRGIARAATTEILRYAFEALQIIRVFLEVRLDNVPALGLYQSLGFMKVQEDQGFVHMEMLATQGHGKHKIAC